jgi:hypothetical protein
MLTDFGDQLDDLITVRGRESNEQEATARSHVLQMGFYSPELVCPARNFVRRQGHIDWLDNRAPCDAIDTLKSLANSVDIIVTDPPYGFNTIEAAESMVDTYQKFMHESLSALKDRGQLILCLPDESHNGQSIPGYAQAEWFDREIRAMARKIGSDPARYKFECDIFPAYSEELSNSFGSRGLFWRSERALTRKVLHYMVRKRILETPE